MRFNQIIPLVILLTAFCGGLHAQVKERSMISAVSVNPRPEDTTRQVDLIDILHKALQSKPEKKSDSIGLSPVISFVPAIGYSLQSRLALVVSGNIAFRTAPQARVSVINASVAVTQNRQVTVPIISSIWSKDNEYNFVGVMRFYKYPQSTYGLGSISNINDEEPMDYNYIRVDEVVLRHIVDKLYMGFGYMIDFHADITSKGTLNGAPSDYAAYGAASQTTSSGLTFNTLFDNRDSPINARSGWYASLQYRQNLEALGSNTDWSSIVLDVRKYFRFPADSKNVLAFWSYDWLTVYGKPPYLDLPATLWDENTNAGRGYIQGRFRGTQMIYGETEYRYAITRNGLLGGVAFFNMQSFSAGPGTRLESIQPGFGPGLRIKVNKVSRTNICVDYGFGSQGSRGLFINIGEMF